MHSYRLASDITPIKQIANTIVEIKILNIPEISIVGRLQITEINFGTFGSCHNHKENFKLVDDIVTFIDLGILYNK